MSAIIITKRDSKTKEADILMVLSTESYDLLKQRDPFGVDLRKMLPPGTTIRHVGVVWGDDNDRDQVVRLMREGKNFEAWDHATRGHVCRPGDDGAVIDMLKGD